jgi:hypothetical protein
MSTDHLLQNVEPSGRMTSHGVVEKRSSAV